MSAKQLIANAYEAHKDHTANFGACFNPICALACEAEKELAAFEELKKLAEDMAESIYLCEFDDVRQYNARLEYKHWQETSPSPLLAQ